MKRSKISAGTRGGIILSAVFLLVLSSTLASGQQLTGALVGKVTDPGGLALPGVSVTITSPQLISQRETTTTDESGQYRIPRLPPGTYRVSFELDGFQTLNRPDIIVRAGQTLTVPAQLELATVQESVTVVGESPLIDVKNSQIRETYDQNLIMNAPNSRNYTDLYHQLPGVEDGQYRELTPGATSINGGTNRDNRVNLDGANINDALVVNTSSAISQEIIEEVQVVTAGIDAEFGGVTAGVMNIITKSGGNEFSGSAYFYYSDDSLQSNNVTSEFEELGVGGATALLEDINGGFTAGGPIVRDRLWFFGSYDRAQEQRTIINFDPLIDGTQDVYFIKLSGQAASNHRLSGFYQYRTRNDFPFIPQSRQVPCPPGVACSGFGVLRTQDHTNDIFFADWTGVFSDNTIVSVRGNISNQGRNQNFPNFQEGDVGYEDSGNRQRFGPWYRAVVHPGSRNTREIKGDVSYYATDLAGSHDFKFGAVYDLLYADEVRAWENGARLHFLFNGEPFRIRLGNNPVSLKANVGTTSLYVQDNWTVGDRLTLNLGLRFENHDVWIPAASSGGINFEKQDFPREDLVNVNTFSPRFGLAYDLMGDHKTVLKATFGKYYNQLYASPFNSLAKFAQGDKTFDWNDLNGDFVYQPGEEGSLVRDTTQTSSSSVDPDLKVPHWLTFSAGVERELGREFRLKVMYVYRHGYNDIERIDPSRPFDEAYNPVTLPNPLNNNEPITIYALDPAFRSVPSERFITNPNSSYCSFCPDIVQKYNGLQFTLEKRMKDRWQLYSTYVFSKAEGNKGTHHRTSQSSLFGNPNNLVNASGATTLNREHSFKSSGSYLAPFDIWLSAQWTLQSGIPLQRDRGVLGPLVRFGRGDSPLIVVEGRIDVKGLPPGEETLDARNLVDVRVEKRVQLGEVGFLGLILDVRNIFNDSSIVFMDDVRLGSSDYLVPGSLVLPRTLRLAARFVF